MGIINSTLAEGATLSATGGTAKTYSTTGLKVNNGIQLIDASVTDSRTRPAITAKSVPATLDSTTSKWKTVDKRELVVTRPKVLEDGSQKFPNVRISLSVHPECSQAEIDALTNAAAQTLFDSDFASFWRTGSLS